MSKVYGKAHANQNIELTLGGIDKRGKGQRRPKPTKKDPKREVRPLGPEDQVILEQAYIL